MVISATEALQKTQLDLNKKLERLEENELLDLRKTYSLRFDTCILRIYIYK